MKPLIHKRLYVLGLFFAFMLLGIIAQAQTYTYKIDAEAFGDNSGHWYGIYDKANIINPQPGRPRYKRADIVQVADNILLFQKNNGGWPKNYDVFAILTDAQKDSVIAAKNILNTTYDNNSTYTQIICLANVYTQTKIDKYKTAAIKGLNFVLASQYGNGGWPQYYPLESNYSRCITYNDGVFEGIIEMLYDIKNNKPEYAFIDTKLRTKLLAAYDKGLDCILKTQINDTGKLTAWCQQYNEVKLTPAWARKFEPPSICNGESCGIVLFLMQLDHPSKAIINAVQSAVAWFEESKIYNTRVKTIAAPREVTPFRVSTTDKIVVTDSAAPPIWTRYYELKTHVPLFCNRTSALVYKLADVTREHRDGYGWYTYNPQKVLNSYHQWQQKWAPDNDVLKK
ncbi:pectate lyase [Mucilaginibacter gracilis]|nr:pectate lyase [Mucilaginibacter gracilis]